MRGQKRSELVKNIISTLLMFVVGMFYTVHSAQHKKLKRKAKALENEFKSKPLHMQCETMTTEQSVNFVEMSIYRVAQQFQDQPDSISGIATIIQWFYSFILTRVCGSKWLNFNWIGYFH